MNILLVSECSKNALVETRRVLDHFAERRGERTWQTAITDTGLDTLRRMLRKHARKNTAVACHWIHGQNHTELLWIVGNAAAFGPEGQVPTHTTGSDILRTHSENDWRTGEDIRLLARMAALWHDFGKASRTFQEKLRESRAMADPLRHEWVSLRMFEAFVLAGTDDAPDDAHWLQRLTALADGPPGGLAWLDDLAMDLLPSGNASGHDSPLKSLPPQAQAIGWLILSHHRLPTPIAPTGADQLVGNAHSDLLGHITHEWAGSRTDADLLKVQGCWVFPHGTPFDSPAWRRRAATCAGSLLQRPPTVPLDNPYLIHLARLTLMLGDHHYSSQTPDDRWGAQDFPLFANTRRVPDATHTTMNQRLDNHLLGVEHHARVVGGGLPRLDAALPRLARHRGFRRRSPEPFAWQNSATDLAEGLRDASHARGFFGIDMASTGTGKTMANGRILYALADPRRGARFTIALGLRTLTLQTGDAYRERLGLGDDAMAVMIGSQAVRELHELGRQKQTRSQSHPTEAAVPVPGSESTSALLADNTHVSYEGSLPEGGLSAWLDQSHNASARKMLAAPLLVCTIDHLMPATDSLRGGHHIAPTLRLLTSDLVLDEPDDFDLADLPALSRLVYWAGMLGSRVLLSSATLPPAMVEGLFAAYRDGRAVFAKNRGAPDQAGRNEAAGVCCAWFDEFDSQHGDHGDTQSFRNQHKQFVAQRVQRLRGSDTVIRRNAVIWPLERPASLFGDKARAAQHWARTLPEQILELHRHNATHAPRSHQRVSFGLVRMANIDPLIDVSRHLCQQTETFASAGVQVHLCVYHSRLPLLMRSALERRLDHILNRQNPGRAFEHDDVQKALSAHPTREHVFVILGSPVTEVGRDHDYDWAIIEPSSVRSIIQLAGRVRRHRQEAWDKVNIHLMERNMRALRVLRGGSATIFSRPGFETKHLRLASDSDSLHDLLPKLHYTPLLDAVPRIRKTACSTIDKCHRELVAIEHVQTMLRLQTLTTDDKPADARNAAPLWRQPRATLVGLLQKNTPFRHQPDEEPEATYALVPDLTKSKAWCLQRYDEEDGRWVENDGIVSEFALSVTTHVSLWQPRSYLESLEALAEELDISPEDCARRFGTVSLAVQRQGQTQPQLWHYGDAVGFQRRD